jgi:methionine synthase I (cobalamin-dependent)
MDSQFNSLLQSYNSNFVQYKVTGNQSYETGFLSAKQGLDAIISSLQSEVDNQKASISDFYKSGVEQKMIETDQNNKKLQRGIILEKDKEVADNIRSQPVSFSSTISTTQYIAMGVLALTIAGLSFL